MADFIGDIQLLPYQVGADRTYAGDVTFEAFVVAGIIASGAAFVGNVTLKPYEFDGGIQSPIPLEPYQVEGTILPGSVFRGDIELEPFEVTSGQGFIGSIRLEPFTVAGAIARGDVFTGDITLPKFTVDGRIARLGDFVGDIVLQPYTVTGSIDRHSLWRGDVQLRPFTVSGSIANGRVFRGDIELEPYTVSARAYSAGIYVGDITLPRFSVEGLLVNETEALTTALVMNTRTNAVTRYSSVPFNSFANFGGVTLGAGPDGIMVLDGEDDAGTPIEAYAEGGVSDFGSKYVKKVPSGYAGYRTTGTLRITLTTDEDQQYEYDLEPRSGPNIHTSRVKFGRGVEGVYWQWRADNVDGSDFDFEHLRLLVEETSRTI